MDQKKELRFRIRMTANDLWRFSMYHANKGYLGVFNVLFTLAALFLLVFQSGQMLLPQRFLLVVCALMFTVWQPMLLLVKARKQAAGRGMKEPIDMFFGDGGISRRRSDLSKHPQPYFSAVQSSLRSSRTFPSAASHGGVYSVPPADRPPPHPAADRRGSDPYK